LEPVLRREPGGVLGPGGVVRAPFKPRIRFLNLRCVRARRTRRVVEVVEFNPPSFEWRLRQVERTYDDIQRLRLAVEVRVKTTRFSLCGLGHLVPLKEASRGACPICGSPNLSVKELEPHPILPDVYKGLAGLERLLYKTLYGMVREHPLWVNYLSMVKGVGPRIAAYLIVKLNPARFKTVSALYKYCGLHVVDGRAPRRRAGEKTDWNPEARTMAWRLGESFRLKGGFYKMKYHDFLNESRAKHPDWTAGHVAADARRRTVKLFLSHWMYVGRRILGLEPVLPYSCVKDPGLHHCIPPVLDKGGPKEKEMFYDAYLSAHFKREEYSYWNEMLAKWLGGRKAGGEEEEEEEA